MTNYQASLLPSGVNVPIVGYVCAFPQHPETGTPVMQFADFPAAHDAAEPHAVVRVDWSTQITTVNLETGASTVEYRSGALGAPSGTSWYLTPVTYDQSARLFRINGRLARGFQSAQLPQLPPIAGTQPPTEVNVHDHPV